MVSPWWEGKSEDEIQAHLAEVRARLEAADVLEQHEVFERAMAETPSFTWPPMPGAAHPSLASKAEWIRSLIAGGEHTIYYHQPRRLKIWEPETEIDPFGEPDPIRVLNVQKVAAPAPWTEHPYSYLWRVAVSPDRRWVAAEDVEVVLAPRYLGRTR